MKLIGTIVESFVINGIGTAVIVDRDCSTDLHVGDFVSIEASNKESYRVNDTILDDGKKFNVQSEKVSSLCLDSFDLKRELILNKKIYVEK